MKTKMTIGLIFMFAIATGAEEKKLHSAHVHGGAKLNIAFDNMSGKIEFKSAAMGILGFEHRAVSIKDKKILEDAIAKFESEIFQMIQFEKILGCQFTKDKIGLISDNEPGHNKKHAAEHSDFIAEFSIACLKPVLGSTVTFDFTSIKGLKDIDVIFLIGDLQKSLEINKKPIALELK
jgi:hypothetical protein